MGRRILATLLTIVSAAWAAGCGGGATTSSSNAGAGVEAVSAPDLYKAYLADARKAEMTYKGKNLKVTGTAHSFKQEGDAQLLQIFVYGEGTETFNVSCKSSEPQWAKDVVTVRLSRPVTFSGTFLGFGDKAANFDRCSLVSSQ
jgi:tRNA_anti-like